MRRILSIMRLTLGAITLMVIPVSTTGNEDVLVYSTFAPGSFKFGSDSWGIHSGQAVAAAFTPGTTITLSDAYLAVSTGFLPVNPLSCPNVFLESDSGGLPAGRILATLKLESSRPAGNGSIMEFGCGGSCPQLLQGTQYWVVAAIASVNGSSAWNFNSIGVTGVAIASSGSAAGPWGLLANSPTPAFRVDGEGVAAQWIQLSPNGGPPAARHAHSAVLGVAANNMVVFAGATFSSSFSDVWRLSGSNGLPSRTSPAWNLATAKSTAPTPRFAHRAVYDAANDRMIVFGGALGFPAPCTNDVWVLASASSGTTTWIKLSPTGAPPAARFYHSAVYDSSSNRMIIFGGGDCMGTVFNDAWVLSNANGLGGTPTWTQLAPSGTAPAARESHSATYDSTNNLMTIFGGQVTGGSPLDDVWVLSNANGVGSIPAWTQFAPSGGPPAARGGHTAIYDESVNVMTVFGGAAPGVDFNDVWTLSSANGLGPPPAWTQLAPFGTPPAVRDEHSVIFDPSTNRMTIFGGQDLVSTTLFDDVWVLTHANGH